MKHKVTNSSSSVNALSFSKRALVLICIVAVLSILTSAFVYRTTKQNAVQRSSEAMNWTQEQKNAKTRLDAVQARAVAWPKSPSIEVLEKQVSDQRAALSGAISSSTGFNSADTVVTIKKVLQSYLQLLLKEPVLAPLKKIESGEGNVKMVFFQQDILLNVEGGYLDLMAYLRDLEVALPGFRWAEIKLDQKKDFSAAVLSVTLSSVQLPADVVKK